MTCLSNESNGLLKLSVQPSECMLPQWHEGPDHDVVSVSFRNLPEISSNTMFDSSLWHNPICYSIINIFSPESLHSTWRKNRALRGPHIISGDQVCSVKTSFYCHLVEKHRSTEQLVCSSLLEGCSMQHGDTTDNISL